MDLFVGAMRKLCLFPLGCYSEKHYTGAVVPNVSHNFGIFISLPTSTSDCMVACGIFSDLINKHHYKSFMVYEDPTSKSSPFINEVRLKTCLVA